LPFFAGVSARLLDAGLAILYVMRETPLDDALAPILLLSAYYTILRTAAIQLLKAESRKKNILPLHAIHT
jgi:hypothetical protein